jgi:hypothetical protein
MRAVVAAVLPLAALLAMPAQADSYTKADFSAGILGGNANLKAPLLGPFSPNQTFAGSFVYDNNLVPGAGSGYANVGFGSFPDIADIPPATAFTLDFGPYTFNLADDPTAMIQYNDGKFNGFVFNTYFLYDNVNYWLTMQGGTFQVYETAKPFETLYMSGYVNIGDAALTNKTPYDPSGVTAPVPEPAAWALMILGFGLIGAAMRRRVRTTVRYA